MALVCILLLSIQCSVDREVKRKKRSRRATTILLSRNRSHSEVPMRNLDGSRFAYASRNTDDTIPNPNTYCEIPLLCNPYHHETQQRRLVIFLINYFFLFERKKKLQCREKIFKLILPYLNL